MIKLKPCPFCGSTNIEYSLKTSGKRGTRYHAAFYCKKCFCYGARILSSNFTEGYKGRVEAENDIDLFNRAKDAWNKRVNNAND